MSFEAPSLKGTKLNMAVKGLELGSLSFTLLHIHQQVQAVAKFGLKEYQAFLIINRGWKEEGAVLPKFVLATTHDFHLSEGDDADKIKKLAKAEALGKLVIQ